MQNLFDKQYNIDGFDMSLKEILTQLLFNGGAWNQLKVNIDAIKSWLQDRYGIDSRDLTFNDDQEFYTYIDNLPHAQPLAPSWPSLQLFLHLLLLRYYFRSDRQILLFSAPDSPPVSSECAD